MTKQMIKYLFCFLFLMLILYRCNSISEPELYYYPSTSVLEVNDTNIELNNITFVLQDSSHKFGIIDSFKKISANKFFFNNILIKNKKVILDIECIDEKEKYKFYFLFIDSLKWDEQVLSIYKTKPN